MEFLICIVLGVKQWTNEGVKVSDTQFSRRVLQQINVTLNSVSNNLICTIDNWSNLLKIFVRNLGILFEFFFRPTMQFSCFLGAFFFWTEVLVIHLFYIELFVDRIDTYLDYISIRKFFDTASCCLDIDYIWIIVIL